MEDHNLPDAVAKRSSQEDPIVMYLIVRDSLNMSAGKACAQVGHACQMLILKFFKIEEFLKYNFGFSKTDPITGTLVNDDDKRLKHLLFKDWFNTSFRKVVLKASDKEFNKIKEEFKDNMILVVDAGLTEIPSGSETVIGLFPMRKSERSKLIKRLQVLK